MYNFWNTTELDQSAALMMSSTVKPDITALVVAAALVECAWNLDMPTAFLQAWLYPSSNMPYSRKFGGGKFGEFGESSMIRRTKTIQISTYN